MISIRQREGKGIPNGRSARRAVPSGTSAHSNALASIFYCGHSSCKFPRILRQCNPRATTTTTPSRARAGAQVLAIEERRLLSRVVFLPLHLPGDNRSRGRDYRVIFSDHTESPRGSWISSNELSLVDESNCGYLRPRKFYAARA